MAVRVQILVTEHWSLLATRGMTWNEMFSRAGMFLTVVSASVVALALMAQATEFGDNFRRFALLLLPIVLLIGLATQTRLADARTEDTLLVAGMNRLRSAYLELAPDLEPYFITGRHDDMAGIAITYGFSGRIRPTRVLASTPVFVGIINAAIAGVLSALAADALGVSTTGYVLIGTAICLLVMGVLVAIVPYRAIMKFQRDYHPRFPSKRPPMDST